MINWLERAKREIQKTPDRPAANADERTLTAAMAAPHPGKSGISNASIGSNGSSDSARFPKIEGIIPPRPTRWSVTLADGQAIEHRAPSGLTEAEALALSRSWGEPLRAEPLPEEIPCPPKDLGALLTRACEGAPGIDSPTFRSLLTREDLEDIQGGHYPIETLRAYAASFAGGLRTGRLAVLSPPPLKAAVVTMVRCGDCQNFRPDTIGDGQGVGECTVQGEGSGPRHPALWPRADRVCGDFEILRVGP